MGTIDLSSGSAKEVVLTVQPGPGASGSRVVAFLQDPKTGHILGVPAQKL